MTTVASLIAQEIDVTPGAETTCRVEIRNSGAIVESYELSVLGEASAWARIEPPTVSLVPGDSATVIVTFQPPRSSQTKAGEVPFGIRVAPSNNPGQGAVPEGVVHVLPFADTGAELRPSTSAGRGGARHEVAVDNRGNVALAAQIRASDSDDLLALTASPSTLSIEAGQAQFARINVKHRKRLWRGQPVTRRFQVQVSPEQGDPITLDGSTVQLPVFSQAVTRGLAALLTLVLLAVGLWFGLVKPTIKSEADKKVQAAVGAGSITEPNLNPNPNPAEPVDPGPTASPPVTVAPSPAAPGVTNTPLRHRFQVITGANSTANSSKLVAPAKGTLVITDIFLQSPQGDVGRLDVMIDNSETLTYGLQNYRNYDEHLVSPLEIATGAHSIWVRVRCTTPGPSIAPYSASEARCRSWVTVVGYIRMTP